MLKHFTRFDEIMGSVFGIRYLKKHWEKWKVMLQKCQELWMRLYMLLWNSDITGNFIPSGVSGIVLKKKKMDEKKGYHDDDDDDVFCTPLSPLQIWKKVSIFEENFETQQQFLYD